MPGTLYSVADLAPTLVFSRFALGFYTVDEAGKMASAKGKPVQRRAAVPWRSLWETEWSRDEHFAMYGALDLQGNQVLEIPRLTKPGLAAALDGIYNRDGTAIVPRVISKAFAGCLALDLDLPGHGKTTPWDDRARQDMQERFYRAGDICPLIMTPTVFYTSQGGLRLVYAFSDTDTPLYGDGGLEDIIAGMIGAASMAGLAFDPACRDWTRVFRLPRVVRDGQAPAYAATWQQSYFRISYGTVDFSAREELPEQMAAFSGSDFPRASTMSAAQVAGASAEGAALVTTDNTWRTIFGTPARGASGSTSTVHIGDQPNDADLGKLVSENKTVEFIIKTLNKRMSTKGVSDLEIYLHAVLSDPIKLFPDRDPKKGLHGGMLSFFGKLCTWVMNQQRTITIEEVYAVGYPVCYKANKIRDDMKAGDVRDEGRLKKEMWDIICHCWRLQTAAIAEESAEEAASEAYKEYLSTQLIKQNENIQEMVTDTFGKWLPTWSRESIVDLVPKSLVIAAAKMMHTLCITCNGDVHYSGGSSDVPELVTFVRDSGHNLIDLHRVNDRGERQLKSKGDILYENGKVIEERRLSRLIEGNRLKDEYGKLVFMQKCHGVRKDIKPVYDERVSRWLTALGGSNSHGLMSWLAGFHRLDRPMAALIIHGDPSIGKGMLLESLQSCTEARLWAPFSQCMETFQDDFEHTPLIVADERADGGSRDRDQSLINTFKKLVTGEYRSINIKHLRRITIEGNWRVVVLGNNAEQLIRFKEDVNDKDLDAFAVRSLYIDSNSTECRRLLAEFGGRAGTDGWPEHVIPQHIEWLRQNYKFEEGKRLLVEGVITRFHENLRINSGGTNVAVTAIGKILNEAESVLLKTAGTGNSKALPMVDKKLASSGIYIRRENAHLTEAKMVIQPSKLRQRMVEIFKDDKTMVVPPLGSVLQSLKFLSKDPAKQEASSYKFNDPESDRKVKDVRGICINTKLLVTTLYKSYDPFDFEHTLGAILWAASKPDGASRADLDASKSATAGNTITTEEPVFKLNKRA
jgi:hypothetical protein